VLRLNEFTALVQSRTLGLEISDNDAKAMFLDYDQHGNRAIDFGDFAYVMNDLMRLHSMKLQEEGHEAWDWFVLYFDDDPNSLPLYLNTQHQVMTYDKPAGIEFRIEHSAEQQFENMVHTASGETYTTIVDETGQV
jgi:Ca2+-binding EF-hand superfamily protein